jgi:uncharacterized protein (DUF58 family)
MRRPTLPSIPSLTDSALLDATALDSLLARGMSAARNRPPEDVQSQYRMMGESPSPYRGSGLDYDESRPYQPGDELRSINWRLMARTGEWYTKTFIEERDTSVLFVIDRRANMRFATHGVLKVTRAVECVAILAGFYAQQGVACGCVLLDDKAHWYPARKGMAYLRAWLMQAAAACPPKMDPVNEVDMPAILSLLRYQATRGSRIVLVSDFHDLSDQQRLLLTNLSAVHRVSALQVNDPVEFSLPDTGTWSLNGLPPGQVIRFNAADTVLRQRYQEQMQSEQAHLLELFHNCGAIAVRVSTTLPYDSLTGECLHVESQRKT